MPRLSADDIAEALGTPKPERTEPTTTHEKTLAKIAELDGRLEKLVEQHRQPGESHEKAASRLYGENPELIRAHKQAKAQILRDGGRGQDAAAGGL